MANKVVVSTYKRLEEYVKLFASKKADLVILESRSGLGKSSTVDKLTADKEKIVFTVQVTPLSNYIHLYNNREKEPLICYRDIDYLLKSALQASLFKQLCETKPIKTIRYFSTSKLLEDIPHEFELKASVLIECNQWNTANENIKAIADRGFRVIFEPSQEEILNKMKEISEQPYADLSLEQRTEVFDFIKDNSKGHALTLRDSIRGEQLYSYSLLSKKYNEPFDWQKELGALLQVPEEHGVLLKLLASKLSVGEQAKEFAKITGKSTRNYWRLKRELMK